MEEGPERDALTAALAKECYVPVYLDPKTVRTSPARHPLISVHPCMHEVFTVNPRGAVNGEGWLLGQTLLLGRGGKIAGAPAVFINAQSPL